MGNFSIDNILELQNKLKTKEIQPTTEEATKQWIIMPFIIALGYNPYSSDVIPEYTLDVGIKKGEKVDYAIQINNQPVALVECKQINIQLSDKHVSQLFRYFTTSNLHIAILTNGDDYWFFTDSKKENIMDSEPYFKFKLSEADLASIQKLEKYSKEQIQYINIAQEVQCERFKNECKNLTHSLKIHDIPTWLLDSLSERSGLKADKPILAKYLIEEIETEFNGYKTCKKTDKASTNNKTTQKNKSDIKLNHEYIYNDYSDGDWTFHNLDYAIILGNKYENVSGRSLLIGVVTELLNQNIMNKADALNEPKLKRIITAEGGYRGAHYIEEHDVHVSTSFGIGDIVKTIEKLLKYAGVNDDQVIVSFKA